MKNLIKDSSVNENRLLWIDVLKGIGIIFVAIGHIYSNEMIFNWIYSFHMPLFFLAAGLVYKKRPIFFDLKRRFKTILIPYFSYGLLELIYYQLIERKFRDPNITLTDSLCGLFSGQYDYLNFNVHLWFLPCFFITVVFSNILINIEKYNDNKQIIFYCVSILMSLIYAIFSLPHMIWGIDRVFKYIGFYAIGIALSKIKIDKYIQKQNTYLKFTEAIILIILNFILAYLNLTTGIMWFITALIGVLGLLIISMLNEKNNIFQYLGQISLTILCVHGPVYRIIIKVISIILNTNTNTNTVKENIFLVMIVVIITLIICTFINIIISKITTIIFSKYQSN